MLGSPPPPRGAHRLTARPADPQGLGQPRGGSDLQSFVNLVSELCSVAYVRIVDKHNSAIWAFCKQWAWDQHVQFVVQERYKPVNTPLQDVGRGLKHRVAQSCWKLGVRPRVALMYLLGNAKSLQLPNILWRPIAAVSRPFVSRHTLRIAARAFTCFLRCLCEEITAAILVLRVTDIAPWVQQLGSWGATCIGEADCKEQFNRIRPNTTVRELRAASQILHQRRRWGALDIVCSVHHDYKHLDRAGKAASFAFWHISHDELVPLVQFSLTEDNYVWCAGQLWQRTDAIPMGGSFSAQCADLHSVWALTEADCVMRRFGDLLQTVPVPLWKTPAGNTVSLSQFRDNVNVASAGPSAAMEMSRVCTSLSEC